METAIPDGNIREALYTVGQYLSDTIPPVQAAESVAILSQQPAHWMASEIIRWVSTQFQGNDREASVVDYLFHGVSKLHYLAHLQLLSDQALAPYLDSVKQLLLDYCPEEEKGLLQENFSRLGMADTELSAPVRFIYRQKSAEKSEDRQGRSPEQQRERRLSILRERLQSAVQLTAASPGEEDREAIVPRLIATAISDTQSSEEFRRLQENLKTLGIESGTDQIFRKLSNGLPGWMIDTTGTGAVNSHNPAMEAMRQVIHLAEDRWDSYKRFQDMVQAAIEQFNNGSLARAATMFDLALGISSDNKLDPEAVAGIRKTAHKSLDSNRLRNVAKERDRHSLLRRVLTFFDEFTVPGMLESLRKEEKRDRRRLLLDLLEAYGEDARKMALDQLKNLFSSTNMAVDWYFARNLVCILNQIPRSHDTSLQTEIALIAPLLRLSLPAPLVKEAIRYIGQNRCPESEELLISLVDKLEKAILDYADTGKDRTQILSLLDRALLALARFGSSKGYARVIRHGISAQEKLGDTSARLAYLSSQDVSSDKEGLAQLIQFLKSKLPRKVFGVTLQKNEQLLLNIVKALSSTPAPIVRQLFEDIAMQFRGTKYGQTAAGALKEFSAADKSSLPAERMLTGDLELFGLPDLLDQLNQRQMTGSLMIRDAKGNTAGTIMILAGNMQDCAAGHLSGKEAAYQLLERPIAGTFVFQGQRSSGSQEPSDAQGATGLKSILIEGMRRYDELQRARAIVPDFSLLKRREPERMIPAEGNDPEISHLIWEKAAGGTSPEECEAICPADCYRIRTQLARWVEAGALTAE